MCAKLRTLAASNNRDHAPQSLCYCLFAPHTHIVVVLRAHHVRGESHIEGNATERLQQYLYCCIRYVSSENGNHYVCEPQSGRCQVSPLVDLGLGCPRQGWKRALWWSRRHIQPTVIKLLDQAYEGDKRTTQGYVPETAAWLTKQKMQKSTHHIQHWKHWSLGRQS